MIFSSEKPIYVQISERLCDEILSGVYKEDDRIPSVRDYSVLLGVNNNTVMKAYEELSGSEIIYNKRGMGYFAAKGSAKQILKKRKHVFLNEQLPQMFRSMKQLNIDLNEVQTAWNEFKEL